MFKVVCELENGPFKKLLRRLRLYYPSLDCLRELSTGSLESLITRSKRFSELLDDVLINGVWKRTGFGRLTVLDEWVVSILPEPVYTPFSILDVGGSDGSTTFDTVRYFQEHLGLDVKATILEMQLRLYCFRRGILRYYLTHDRIPLLIQIGLLGALLEETKGKEGFIVNPIVRVTKKWLLRSSFEKYLQDYGDLLLESPLVRNCPDIVWLERDLFRFDPELKGVFDFIRCCNVLNCGYFSKRQIYDAVQLLALYLKPKGLLLVSRTIDDSAGFLHSASLWMKTATGLVHVADLNGGLSQKPFASNPNTLSLQISVP